MESGGERDRLLEWHPAFPGAGLFSRLVGRVPLRAVLKSKGVQEEETLFQKEVLKTQEQPVPLYQKRSHQVGSACLNRKLWLDLRKKKRGGRKLRKTTRMS